MTATTAESRGEPPNPARPLRAVARQTADRSAGSRKGDVTGD